MPDIPTGMAGLFVLEIRAEAIPDPKRAFALLGWICHCVAIVVCLSKSMIPVSADDGAQYRAAMGEWSQFNTKSAKWVLLDL
jgi:hypothetical protein